MTYLTKDVEKSRRLSPAEGTGAGGVSVSRLPPEVRRAMRKAERDAEREMRKAQHDAEREMRRELRRLKRRL